MIVMKTEQKLLLTTTVPKFRVIINPRRMCWRVTVVILCVCVSVCQSVTKLATTYLVCKSCGVTRFLMAFQTHDLCEFRQNALITSFGIIY